MTHTVKLQNDDADTTVMRFDGIRGQRYAEIILIVPAQTCAVRPR